MHDALTDWCRSALADHLRHQPGDRDRLAEFATLLARPPGPLHDRRTLPGHVTASGVLVDVPTRRLLLIHHVGLNRWLPPGGHLEPGELPIDAARRELREEVGITIVGEPIGGGPVDVDSHAIPANAKRGEPAHTHHDFRFAFAVDADRPTVLDAAEVAAAAWVPFDDRRVPDNLRPAVDRLVAVLSSS